MQLLSDSIVRSTEDNGDVASSVLRVSNLTVSAATPGNPETTILDDVSFDLGRGEALGVLGESGAGKSTLALAMLNLVPRGLRIVGGEMSLNGKSLLRLNEDGWQSIRGNEISFVYQDSSALNPVLRIEHQVAEVIRAHRNWNKARCRDEARSMLALVGLGEERMLSAYPHQLSGGQKQRVAIAQALVCGPSLLIADEPTASLDPATSLEILDLIRSVRKRLGTALLLISHQPDVLAYLCDRVLVLYTGQVIEEGPVRQVFESPLHPYTRELLRCRQPLEGEAIPKDSKPLWPFIPGNGDTHPKHSGCVFYDRCAERMEICGSQAPRAISLGPGDLVKCFAYAEEGA